MFRMKQVLAITALISGLGSSCDDAAMQQELASAKASLAEAQETIDALQASQEAGFGHIVFFWMKEEISAEQKKQFEAGMEALGKVSTISSYKWGTVAESDRDVVDDTYDYSWIVYFKDKAGEEAYQTDSIHLNFIEQYEALWDKVVVYDTFLK